MRDLAIEFVRCGHDVVLAAPDPTSKERITVVEEAGFTALRFSSGRLKGAGRVFRTINEWRLSPRIWSAGKSFFREKENFSARLKMCSISSNVMPMLYSRVGRLIQKISGSRV